MKNRIFFLYSFVVLGSACILDNSSGVDGESDPTISQRSHTSSTTAGSGSSGGNSTVTGSQGDTSGTGTGTTGGSDTGGVDSSSGGTGIDTTAGTTSSNESTGTGVSSSTGFTGVSSGGTTGFRGTSSGSSTGSSRDAGAMNGSTGSIGGRGDASVINRDAGATGGHDAGMGSSTGGSPDSGGADPLNAASKCTSNQKWSGAAGLTMRPGENCRNCHTFTIAGTVFPSGHEPNDCNGQNGGLNVVITDKNGKVTTLPINNVGNFETSVSIATPFTAKIVNTATGKQRAMTMSQTEGGCNSCHTQTGTNGAPGRLTAPF